MFYWSLRCLFDYLVKYQQMAFANVFWLKADLQNDSAWIPAEGRYLQFCLLFPGSRNLKCFAGINCCYVLCRYWWVFWWHTQLPCIPVELQQHSRRFQVYLHFWSSWRWSWLPQYVNYCQHWFWFDFRICSTFAYVIAEGGRAAVAVKDHCALGAIDCHETLGICTNTAEGHSCSCKSGYTGDGFTCEGNKSIDFDCKCWAVGTLIQAFLVFEDF